MKTRFLLLSFVTACVSPRPSDSGPSFDSVRDRLAAGPTNMWIAAIANAGSLDGAHNTDAGWQTGVAPVSISSGAFVASSSSGELLISSLDVSFEPIDLPPSVFGTAAQLSNVRLQLPQPTVANTIWTDDDNATAAAALQLSLSWSLEVNGGVLPLGDQTLPLLPIEVKLDGDGDSITASLSLHGAGQLWSWADLLEVTELDVTADAVTE
jgi:hypothetical protein